MAQSQALEAQEKKELVSKEEKTVPARYYVPNTDIHETDDALVIVMEVPGVDKKDLSVDLGIREVRHLQPRVGGVRDGLAPVCRLRLLDPTVLCHRVLTSRAFTRR